jgi:uncharacterized membrane protein
MTTTPNDPAIRRSEKISRHGAAPQRPVNVGQTERIISLAGGGLLAACGLSRGNLGGLVLGAIGAGLVYRGWTGHCDVYQALGMNSAQLREGTAIPSGQGIKVEESVTIHRPAEELFRYWKQLDNLPRVMRHLVSVTPLGPRRSKWVAQGLTGEVEWEADILEERENELISWKSTADSQVATAGSVRFRSAPGERGTEVQVVLSYNPPAGSAGHALAWLAGRDPARQIREDLQAFKRLMEAGTTPTTKGQTSGRTPSGSVSRAS